MKRLSGKTALITGGNSGIGFAAAKTFVQEGARVAITGRNPATLGAAVKELGEAAVGFTSDASRVTAIGELAAQVGQQFGRLDILFANAGIGRPTPLATTEEGAFDQVFGTNVKGVFFLVQKFLPLLTDGSSIILTGSGSSRNGAPNTAAYAASKAAVRAFARVFSADLAPRRIRVNVVTPGPIDTPIWGRTGAPAAVIENVMKRIAGSVPAGRMGSPEEVARAVLFLASEDSTFMLGSEIVVDGGVTQLPAGAPVYR